MSFQEIAKKHSRTNKFPARTYDLNLLLRVVAPELDGGLYDDCSMLPFHQEWQGKTYLELFKRKPNVPEGTNTIRTHVHRQANMLFGPERFPAIETTNEVARKVLNDFIEESEIEDRFREAVVLGSVGSIAHHVRVLSEDMSPDEPARIYLENYTTSFLTAYWNKYRPDVLDRVVEKYTVPGAQLQAGGWDISDDDARKEFWFMREWDDTQEIWYVPWTKQDEDDAKNKKQPFQPVIDTSRTVTHGLGICPWLWTRNLPIGRGVDGTCQFKAALDHAVNLDYLVSQIAAAVKYTMSPTMVIEKTPAAAGAPNNSGTGEAGFVNAPGVILTIDASGKAYYLEISGEGIEKARLVAEGLRKAIVECMSGDRFEPDLIKAGHQGAKSMAMMQEPMLGLCDQLKSSYGTSLKRLLKMVETVIHTRPVEINGDIVDAAAFGQVKDLKLAWGAYYEEIPSELYAQAQAMDLNLKNGLLCKRTAMMKLASTYNIADISDELAAVAEDQAEMLARDLALGKGLKAVQSLPNA
jgi:hypothetical protein